MARERFSVNFGSRPDPVKSDEMQATQSNQSDYREIDDLFSATYEELRRLAAYVKLVHGQQSLSPTTLVNEAWLKMAESKAMQFESQMHFKAVAARAMRQILVDKARRQGAYKRGGEVVFVTFDDISAPVRCDQQLLALHESLEELARLNPRQALLVESRYFGGMDVAETAQLLKISEATVLRSWRAAKAWLGANMQRQL